MIIKLIVAFYLLMILTSSIYYRTKFHSLQDFGIARSCRSINSQWVFIINLLAIALGGEVIFGIAEKSFGNNLAWSYGIILASIVNIIFSFWIIPKLIEYYGSISIGDIIYDQYGSCGKVLVGIGVILISTGYIAAQISVSSRIFSIVFGINHADSLILSYLIIIIYTSVEGTKAVAITHILRLLAMILTIPLVTVVGIYKIGFNNLLHHISPMQYSLQNTNLLLDTLKIGLSFSVISLCPNFIQKILTNNNSKATNYAVLVKYCAYVFFVICIAINGLLALCVSSGQISTNAILSSFDILFPPIIQGVLLVGILSLVISIAQSNLNTMATSIKNDIVYPLLGVQRREMSFLVIQCITVFIGSISVYIALKLDNTIDLIMFMSGFWISPLLVPILFCLCGIKIHRVWLILNSILGLLTFLIWEYYKFAETYGIAGVFVGTIASFIFFTLVKFLSYFNNIFLATK